MELTNGLHKKEKEMLRAASKVLPNKGKGKETEKEGETAAKLGGHCADACVVKVTCHDAMNVGQPVVQQMIRHSVGKSLKLVAKRNRVLTHYGCIDQAANCKKFHRVANLVGGHAPVKVQQLVGRWFANMIAWVTRKLQDEAKQGLHGANRGAGPASHADKCHQRRPGIPENCPGGNNLPRKEDPKTASVSEVSREDWQKRITSGGVLTFDQFGQQHHQGLGCCAWYRKFERNQAQKKEWCNNQSTCEVCQSFVKWKRGERVHRQPQPWQALWGRTETT